VISFKGVGNDASWSKIVSSAVWFLFSSKNDGHKEDRAHKVLYHGRHKCCETYKILKHRFWEEARSWTCSWLSEFSCDMTSVEYDGSLGHTVLCCDMHQELISQTQTVNWCFHIYILWHLFGRYLVKKSWGMACWWFYSPPWQYSWSPCIACEGVSGLKLHYCYRNHSALSLSRHVKRKYTYIPSREVLYNCWKFAVYV
jgi:hypothetical protein